MASRLLTLGVALSALISDGVASGSKVQWRYGKGSEREHWGAECEGAKQSPININDYDVDPERTQALRLHGYGHVYMFAAENSGHAVTFTTDDSDDLYVYGSNLKGKYMFKQLHFHWKSEHTVNNNRYPLEIHFVHVLEKYANYNISNLKEKNSVLVLSVLFYENKNTNIFLDRIFSTMRRVSQPSDKSRLELVPRHLLPVDLRVFYQYEGSLTTPHCNEIVQWIVFQSKIPISSNQYNLLKNVKLSDGTTNFRSIQSLNNRKVILVHTRALSIRCGAGMELIAFNLLLVLYFKNSKF